MESKDISQALQQLEIKRHVGTDGSGLMKVPRALLKCPVLPLSSQFPSLPDPRARLRFLPLRCQSFWSLYVFCITAISTVALIP